MYVWAAANLWGWVNPAFVIPLVLLLAIALLWTPWRRFGRRVATIAAIAYVALIVLPVGGWLTMPLENRFPAPSEMPAQVDGILVLGGSVSPGLTVARGQPALNANAERLVEFVALARRYPDARLAFTGGGKSVGEGHPTEATISLLILDQLGLDTSRVVVEDRSTDTYGNAVLTREIVHPRAGETWLLVTSAWHMPRAMGAFRAAGWSVVPYPVDYTTGGALGVSVGLDPIYQFPAITLAVHEWVGLLVYRLLGRSNELFPSP